MRALLLSLTALAAPAAAAAHEIAPQGSVRVVECTSALEPAARAVTFEGRMRPIARSVTMAIRFTLQARTVDASRWRHVPADGFDAWLPSEPGVRRYTYEKTVRALPAPASYRVTVRFRWHDAAGHVLARSEALSAPCAQDDLRPDPVARRIELLPTAEPGTARYAVQVRNAGATDSGAFALRLDVAGHPPQSATVLPLAAGETRTVSLLAPACEPGGAVTATVDADGQVDEADEAANVLTIACPPA
jgi:hypothetical protein